MNANAIKQGLHRFNVRQLDASQIAWSPLSSPFDLNLGVRYVQAIAESGGDIATIHIDRHFIHYDIVWLSQEIERGDIVKGNDLR